MEMVIIKNYIDYSYRIVYTIHEVNPMETRTCNLMISTSGGTAGGIANNYKISLPSTWVQEMGLDAENRQIELCFDGTSITITKKLSFSEFLEANRQTGHKLFLISCYSGSVLCARIAADKTAKKLRVENLVSDFLKLPFGNNRNPSWEDYLYFLESRCIPRTRAGLREYLETIGVDHYDPLEIIRKTQGRMAEDDLWLTVEEIK